MLMGNEAIRCRSRSTLWRIRVRLFNGLVPNAYFAMANNCRGVWSPAMPTFRIPQYLIFNMPIHSVSGAFHVCAAGDTNCPSTPGREAVRERALWSSVYSDFSFGSSKRQARSNVMATTSMSRLSMSRSQVRLGERCWMLLPPTLSILSCTRFNPIYTL